jgi:hypothetical protein
MDDMTSIDAPAVRAMGVAVEESAERLAGAAARIREWEYLGRDAVDGARVCGNELTTAAWAWQLTVDGLAAMVRDYGRELRAAAGDFEATDAAAAEVLPSAGKPGA